jgi:hypothetical protein
MDKSHLTNNMIDLIYFVTRILFQTNTTKRASGPVLRTATNVARSTGVFFEYRPNYYVILPPIPFFYFVVSIL